MMLYLSRYNHLVHVQTGDGRDIHILNNLLYGASTIVSETIFNVFLDGESGGTICQSVLPEDVTRYFTRLGYLRNEPAEEERLLESLGGTYGNRDEIAARMHGGQYGFITSLYCNLSCPYCFQKEWADSCGYLTERQIDLGLDAIERSEARVAKLARTRNTVPKISITGGEPLLRSKRNLTALDYLVSQLKERGWPFNITTNGTELERYVATHDTTDLCRNIQVTLDGPEEVHDQRRNFRGGAPSFRRISDGVDTALKAGWKVTLRVNLDLSNVSTMPELADFIRRCGWLDFDAFSAYVSPVTDHASINDEGPDESDLLQALLEVIESAPETLSVLDIKHFRGFNYVEQIVLHHKPRFPVVFRCEAATGMFIFDPRGDVHVCLEAVGDSSMRVGRYDPKWELDDIAFSRWANRNVMQLEHCRNCKVRFVCAGGCAKESFNKGDGNACMPFLREMNIAWDHFARTRPELFN